MSNFGTFAWSKPYYDIDTQELVITCSKAFRDPNLSENVVIGLDMTINSLNDMISALSSSSYGHLMLVNNEDVITLHSDQSQTNSLIQSYNDDLLVAEFHAETPIYRTDTGIFMQRTLEKQNMYLIRYFSMDELNKEIMPFAVSFILIIGVFLLVSIITSFNLSRHITTPLLDLKNTMSQGLSTNLLEVCHSTSNDEIGELIDGYNFLVGDINEKTLEMTALYEQLTASEEALQEQYDQLYENKEQIRKTEEKYHIISEASTQGLMEIRPNNTLIFHSKKWFDKFSFPSKHKELNDWIALIIEEDKTRINEALMDHFNKKTAVFDEEYRIRLANDKVIWISSIGQAQYGADGVMKQMIISNNDITQRKASESEILKMAYTDGLTGLLNRMRLKEVITKSINNKEQGTMFYINLDNFKSINDTYGHSYGDQVLIELSKRLNFCVDSHCEIARLSGDEFAVVKIDTLSLSAIEGIAKKIIETISKKVVINNLEIYTSASIGAASYPYDAESFEELMVNADISMHKAKSTSKDRFVIFTESIKNEMLLSMNIERHLNQAISHNEFSVYYQPVVRANTGQVVGFEALTRWNNPELGSIPPDVFIPIAEKNKLIIPLGTYVMKESLQFIIALNKKFGTRYEIALNISAIELQQEGYCNSVFDLLDELSYPIEHLNLEITESIALDSNPTIIKNIKLLKESGVPISLDDFGTGYSTFNNLIELPLSHLKLDKDIVQRSVTDDYVYKLLNSIIEFSHKLNIEVIAEGIEDIVMLERMKQINIDFTQGYMYSKPVDSQTLIHLIESKQI
jgi:diguanylate cyclase (GGDEF)-like protein